MKVWVLLTTLAVWPLTGQQLESDNLAPFLPSPQIVVDKMLESAQVKPGEMVYDLGCGDGRVVITAAQKFKAKAVGIELSEYLANSTAKKVRSLGLDSQVSIVHGNALKVDLSPADVIVVYLLTGSNDRLRPLFEKYLKAGARVVSHDYVIRGWEPSRVEKVMADHRPHTIYVYTMKGAEKVKSQKLLPSPRK